MRKARKIQNGRETGKRRIGATRIRREIPYQFQKGANMWHLLRVPHLRIFPIVKTGRNSQRSFRINRWFREKR